MPSASFRPFVISPDAVSCLIVMLAFTFKKKLGCRKKLLCEKILLVLHWFLDVGALTNVFTWNMTRTELFSCGINLSI